MVARSYGNTVTHQVETDHSLGGMVLGGMLLGAVLLVIFVAASPAPVAPLGDTPASDAVLELGDKVVGTLDSGEGHVLEFEALAGTRFTAKAARKSGFLLVGLRLEGPGGQLLVDEADSVLTLKKARINDFKLLVSGTYRLTVFDLTDQGGGSYKLGTKGVRDTFEKDLVTVDGEQAPPPVEFSGVQGELIKRIELRSLKPKGLFQKVGSLPAALLPQIDHFGVVDGQEVSLAGKTQVTATGKRVRVRNVTLPVMGDYALQVGGAGGSVGYARVIVRRAKLKADWKVVVLD